MANSKEEKEELKSLEDKAYFELCQIIAEAMQVQDIELLDYRIASWKHKYKKLLDGLASPEFKKKIEYLLNEYYSSVTQYIYSQIKFKENKKIENQSKALVKLYRIIKETNDLKTLKSKVKNWESQYPKSSFLKMYQKRIDSYTNTKNLEANAFNQDAAFSDLVDITKHTGTFEDFVKEREEWEKKYSIHNKFELDDFIKHQSEVKRYTSEEYLHSISRDTDIENQNDSNSTIELPNQTSQEETSNKMYSDLSKQSAAYTSLLEISKKINNVSEMFKWVYKNSSIKFNNKYKELILNATYLDYSPTYLNKLKTPNLNINNKSLSYEEFNEMNDIKKYAIISYFNLLLPSDRAIANNFFNSCINTVYTKSEEARLTNSALNELEQKDLKNGIEIKLSKPDAEQEFNLPELKEQEIPDTNISEISNTTIEEIQEIDTSPEKKLQEDLSYKNEDLSNSTVNKDESKEEIIITVSPVLTNLAERKTEDNATVSKPQVKTEEKIEPEVQEPDNSVKLIKEEPIKLQIEDTPNSKNVFSEPDLEISSTSYEKETELDTAEPIQEPLQQEEIITISPLLFSAINYKAKQADAIKKIDEHVNEYVLVNQKTFFDTVQTKQKTD